MQVAFLAEGDDVRVLRFRSLLDLAVHDRGLAAVRQVDRIAGGAGGPVDEAAVADDRLFGAALHLMADAGAVEIAVLDREPGQPAQIEIVGEAGRWAGDRAVGEELAPVDGDGPDAVADTQY